MGPFVVVALAKSLAGTAATVLLAPVSVTSADVFAFEPNENPNDGVMDGFGAASLFVAIEPKVTVVLGLEAAGLDVAPTAPKPLPN